MGAINSFASVVIREQDCTSLPSSGFSQPWDALPYRLTAEAVDRVGAAEWGALLSQGVSRNQVVFDLLTSPEYDQHLVAGFYTMFLNRAADPGSIGWVNALLQGMRDETAIAGITASPEFFNLAQNG
jgi:hypothetical protein